MFKNLITTALILSCSGCASWVLKEPEPTPIETPPAIEETEEQQTSLYSIFFDDEPATQDPQVIKPYEAQAPIKAKVIEQAQPAAAIVEAEAQIEHVVTHKEKASVPVVVEKEDDSLFSIFSSTPKTIASPKPQKCVGDTELPIVLKRKFEAVEDDILLSQALGGAETGKLCKGQVYRVKKNAQVNLFRLWNSHDANTKYGHWWSFNGPRGQVASYRKDNALCYQWTPLDKLSHCRIKAGTKVVFGTGQSVRCSDKLQYGVSETQQVFILDAQHNALECRDYDAQFSWKASLK